MPSTTAKPDPEIFSEIIDDAVAQILHHQDPERFFDWFERRKSEAPRSGRDDAS